MIPKSWILLDSGFSKCTIMNRDLVENVRSTDEHIRVYSNGRDQDFSNMKVLKLFPFLLECFDSSSLVNVFYLYAVRKAYCVTLDSVVDTSMFVHITNDKVLDFKECRNGIYYLDVSSKKIVSSYSFLSAVALNESYFLH